jgi:DNA polymerase-3 subunit gamma/tau
VALALYRKYRPRTFAEVIGQEHVTEPLSQALRSGRLNHAYLFSGPRGCGKTSSARILARSLNCEQGPTPEPCGQCLSCRSLAVDGAGSIDVIEIDAASHGGVDDARELREKAFFAPANSRFKIYVIDEAHMVSTQGFNALLKLVEEPPEYVKFIFATTEPDKVLGTIRSRTHHYPFRLIPPATLRPYLAQLCEAEGVHVDPAVLPLVIRAGGGSARDSLSILDQLIAGAGPDGVGYARAVALLGVTDTALIDEMCDALAAGDGAAAYGTIDRVAEAGHDPRRFASDLLERLRDLIIMQQIPDAVAKGLIDGPTDQMERMTGQSGRLGPATLSRCADIVHNGLVEMRGTTAPRLLLELITARMLLPGAEDSTGALLQRLERMERRLTLGDTDNHAAVRAPAPSVPQTATPQPTAGQPTAGQPTAGQPTAGQPTAGQPTAGQSTAGQSTAGQLTAGQLTAGQLTAGQPSSGRPNEFGAAEGQAVAQAVPGPTPTSVGPAESTSRGRSPAGHSVDGHAPDAASAAGRNDGHDTAARPSSGQGPAGIAAAPGSADVASTGRVPESAVMPDPPVQVAAAAPVVGQLSAASIRDAWPEIVSMVGRKSKKIAALAQGATVRDLDGQTVVLAFRFPAHAKMVAAQPELLSDALYETLGGRWQIRCDLAGEGNPVSAARSIDPAPTAPPAQAPQAQVQAAQVQAPQASDTSGFPASAPQAAAPQAQTQQDSHPGAPVPTAAAAHVASSPEAASQASASEASAPQGGAPQGAAPRASSPQAAAVRSPAAGSSAAGPGAGSGGGSSHGSGPATAVDVDDSAWPEPARPGGFASPEVAPRQHAPASANGSATEGPTSPGSTTPPSTGPGSANPGSAAAGSAAGPAGGGVATQDGRARTPGGGRAAGATAALAAARAAAAGGGGAAARAAAAGSAWSDGSPAEEPPYDPDYDGPIRPGMNGAAPTPTIEGFDPGDEPLDVVIDEKTARQSSEQQAVQLLRDAFGGAEKIGES